MSKNVPLLGPVFSAFTGGDSAKVPTPPPPPPPPAEMPIPDDAAAKKAQTRRRAAMVAQGGRLSTILTSDNDKLGA